MQHPLFFFHLLSPFILITYCIPDNEPSSEDHSEQFRCGSNFHEARVLVGELTVHEEGGVIPHKLPEVLRVPSSHLSLMGGRTQQVGG